MKNISTPAEKANFTNAVRKYLAAKKAEADAKKSAEAARAEILNVLGGDTSADWTDADGGCYHITAVYGKCSKTLNADLIKSVLGVQVTAECYKASRFWGEIRITLA